MGIESSPEPTPYFVDAFKTWGVAWDIHIYLFGAAFGILVMLITDTILGLTLATPKIVKRRRIFIVINSLLLYFCFITTLNLLVDPYLSGYHIKTIRCRGLLFIVNGMRIPCLTASFMLIEISFLETIKLQLYSKRIQNMKFTAVIVVVHFLAVLIADVIFVVFPNMDKIVLSCVIFTLLLGLVICVTSIYSYIRIKTTYSRSQRTLSTYDTTRQPSTNSSTPLDLAEETKAKLSRNAFRDKSLRKIAITTLCLSIVGLMYCLTTIYSLFEVFMRDGDPVIPAWPWFIMSTSFKISELGMMSIMFYVVRRSWLLSLIQQ